MRMDPGLDTGPMLLRRAEPVRSDDTTATLSERLAALGAEALLETLAPWVAGTLTPNPQNEAEATLTRPLRREDGRIDWAAMPATIIERMIRAYDPWPGAYTSYNGRLLKLWQATVIEDAVTGTAPGHVLNRDEAAPLLQALGLRWPRLLVVTAEGLLLLRRVQPEGKRVMGGDEFMRGQPGVAGAQLG
jgi:methionyl-tRNA formyltransferase